MKVGSEDLNFFRTLASCRSLADAARLMDVSPAAVTLRLQQIEARLGVRLIDRSSRRMALTGDGELVLARARSVLADLDSLGDELEARRDVVSGILRVLAPIGFGRAHVAGALARFRGRYPAVRAELMLSDRIGRLTSQSWDLAIHIGELPDTRLAMQTLAPNERWLCAAPEYLARHGQPAEPADLKRHACLALRENDEDVTHWRFRRGDGVIGVRIEPALASNDGDVVKAWALDGQGIILRSEWHVADDVAAGRLQRLLPDYAAPPAPVVVLMAGRSNPPARVRHFIEQLRADFASPPWRTMARR